MIGEDVLERARCERAGERAGHKQMERSCLLPRCGVCKRGKRTHKHTAGQEQGREACRALCRMEGRTKRCSWPSWSARRRFQHMCGRSPAHLASSHRRPTSHKGHGCRIRGHAAQEVQPRSGSAGVASSWLEGVRGSARELQTMLKAWREVYSLARG